MTGSTDDGIATVTSLDEWRNDHLVKSPEASAKSWVHTNTLDVLDLDATLTERRTAGRIVDVVVEYVDALVNHDPSRVGRARRDAIAALERVESETRALPRALDELIRAAHTDRRTHIAAAVADLRSELATPSSSYLIHNGRIQGAPETVEANAIERLEFVVTALSRIDETAAGPARWALVRTHFATGNTLKAVGLLDEAIDGLERHDHRVAPTATLDAARILMVTGEPARAGTLAYRALSLYAAVEDQEGIADACQLAGDAALARGEHVAAIEMFERASTIHHELRHSHAGHRADVARAKAYAAGGNLTAADGVLRGVWTARLALDPSVSERRFRDLPRVHAAVARGLGRNLEAETFEHLAARNEDGRLLVDPEPQSAVGPTALAALAHALEASGDPRAAAAYWLASAYACAPETDAQLAEVAVAAYRRAATDAGHSIRYVETVASRVTVHQTTSVSRGQGR